jgi:hypothetical protein
VAKKKNPAAVALAKLRSKKLTAEERSDIARKAGTASKANLTPSSAARSRARRAWRGGGAEEGGMSQEEMQFIESLFRSLETEMNQQFHAVNARLII